MPLGWGSTGVFSSSGDVGGGRQFTRLLGPLLVGGQSPSGLGMFSTASQTVLNPPSLVNVSTAPSDMIMNAGVFLSTLSVTGYVYIPTTTVGFSSSTNAAVGPVPAPPTIRGAALVFDSARKKLSIYSTDVGDWVSVTLSSS